MSRPPRLAMAVLFGGFQIEHVGSAHVGPVREHLALTSVAAVVEDARVPRGVNGETSPAYASWRPLAAFPSGRVAFAVLGVVRWAAR